MKGNGDQQDYGMRIYDNRLGRFLSADPLITQYQKYPELSTYQFASNTPVWGVDWDGLELRIYTSTSGLTGHTFLTVGSGKHLVVYSYGQYGKPKYSLFGGFSPRGEGVLYRLSGRKARNFIRQYVKYEGAKVYEITDADENKAKKNLDSQFLKGKPATEGKAKDDPNAKVINDTYGLMQDNCATKTGDETIDAGSKLTFEKKESVYVPGSPGQECEVMNPVNTPAEMENYLHDEAQKKGSAVKDVTKQMIKEVEQKEFTEPEVKTGG